MKVEEYRSWFIVGSFALMLLATAPALALFIQLPSDQESFSELWLLGAGHKASDYPFNVTFSKDYRIYLGVGNNLGYPAYYKVYVKLRNQTQPLPTSLTSSNSTPSPLNPIHEFQMFLPNGRTWETQVDFAFQGQPRLVSSIRINEVSFPINCSSSWDEKRVGFYYQLFFELWLYNTKSSSFQYNNRFVAIWLNVTSTL